MVFRNMNRVALFGELCRLPGDPYNAGFDARTTLGEPWTRRRAIS